MTGIEETKTSTPNINASKRRSLFNQSVIASSPLVVMLERNAEDDEEERRMRRAEAARRSLLADQSMTEKKDRRSFSDSYIMNEYKVSTQLFNENKITVKNAWHLRIIEILKPLCHRRAGEDLLQIAGTSLKICAKVFCIRVDDLHAKGVRLANDMARVAANHEADNRSDIDEDGQGEEGEDGQPAKKKQKKRRVVNPNGPKRTVSKDAQKFFGPLPKLEPADISNRVKADFGNIESLCTLTFPMNSKNCAFIILNEEERFNSTADIVDMDKSEEDHPMIDFEQIPVTPIPKTCKIMLPFKDFEFNKENPEHHIQPRTGDPSEVPPVQLDGTIHDPFQHDDDLFNDMDNDGGNSIHEEIGVAEAGQASAPHLVDKERTTIFGPQEEAQTQVNGVRNRAVVGTMTNTTGQSKLGDSFNFDHIDITTGLIIDKVWAGPAHWKLKNVVHTTKEVFTGRKEVQKQKRARKKKEPCAVDFNIDIDDINIDFSKKVISKPGKTVPDNKLFLPKVDDRLMDYLQNPQRMDELFIKPGTYASDLKRMWNRDTESFLEDKNADDGFDNSQFVPADDNMPDFDNDGANGDALDCEVNGGLEGSEHVAAEQRNLQDNLVEAPQMVNLKLNDTLLHQLNIFITG
ncbi:unnamed protein product [Acanthoscelides obtectus]|uniref:Condensin complex subunit 2 n=1 Tax=Acanthoscelides obtectus TaxID=200917 RepID=A0A9P0LJJ5_ACAOB|nr:unnamed protein product [Acanthoscelides obtectus]CAK1670068.1 Condensin complex subunit 2 [Acanthoscelides obtectus]